MTGVFWFAVCGSMLAAGGVVWYALRQWKARQLAEEQRLADFMAATAGKARLVEASSVPMAPATPATPAAIGDGLALQKLLFESAHKAGEAGEPALAIQLYARLLARYPSSGFAGQAHAAVEAQKRKLAKG